MAKNTKRLQIREQIAKENGTFEVKKPRKKRKPMTPEQREAAIERLAKARAARAPAKQPNRPDFFSILPDNHPMSWSNTNNLIKEQKLLVKALRSLKDSNKWQDRSKLVEAETYLEALNRYTRTGIMGHTHGGREGSQKLRFKSVALAYDKNGNVKRSIGVYYPDLGQVWTQDMQIAKNPVVKSKPKKRKKRVKKAEAETIIDITNI